MDEYGKIIEVDFKRKKVNLTFEYEKKSGKVTEITRKFAAAIRLIGEATEDQAFTRSSAMKLDEILNDIIRRRENKWNDRHR